MNGSHRQTTFTSKFVALYTKLLQGVPPSKVDPNGNPQQLLLDLLDLKVDAAFLSGELLSLSRETCLGKLKVRLITGDDFWHSVDLRLIICIPVAIPESSVHLVFAVCFDSAVRRREEGQCSGYTDNILPTLSFKESLWMGGDGIGRWIGRAE